MVVKELLWTIVIKMNCVKKIIIINLAVFGVCHIFNFWGLHLENLFALYPVNTGYFSFYQLVTHLFIHANPEHLFFNMLFFLIAGIEVEEYFGKKFLSFYLLSGIFSSGLYCLGSNGGIIGASGAVFSVLTVFTILTIRNENFKHSIHLKIKSFFYIFFILIELYNAVSFPYDNIGHWSHIFGVIFGTIFYIHHKKSLS